MTIKLKHCHLFCKPINHLKYMYASCELWVVRKTLVASAVLRHKTTTFQIMSIFDIHNIHIQIVPVLQTERRCRTSFLRTAARFCSTWKKRASAGKSRGRLTLRLRVAMLRSTARSTVRPNAPMGHVGCKSLFKEQDSTRRAWASCEIVL